MSSCEIWTACEDGNITAAMWLITDLPRYRREKSTIRGHNRDRIIAAIATPQCTIRQMIRRVRSRGTRPLPEAVQLPPLPLEQLAWLELIGVHPAQQNRGLGSQLVHLACRRCRQSGKTQLRLLAQQTNPAAIAFYGKQGFQPCSWHGENTTYVKNL